MHTCSVTISSVPYNGFIDRLANLHSVSLRYLDTLPHDGDTSSIGFSEQYCSGIYVCSTVWPILSGLETRSIGLNTLGTALSPASSQSVEVSRASTASWV